MPIGRPTAIFPDWIRRYVLVALVVFTVTAAVLIAWRGPAILLDLGGMIVAICF